MKRIATPITGLLPIMVAIATCLAVFTFYSVAWGVSPSSSSDWTDFISTNTSIEVSGNYIAVVYDYDDSGTCDSYDTNNSPFFHGVSTTITPAQQVTISDYISAPSLPLAEYHLLCLVWYNGGWYEDPGVFEYIASTPTPTPSDTPTPSPSGELQETVLTNTYSAFTYAIFFSMIFAFMSTALWKLVDSMKGGGNT